MQWTEEASHKENSATSCGSLRSQHLLRGVLATLALATLANASTWRPCANSPVIAPGSTLAFKETNGYME